MDPGRGDSAEIRDGAYWRGRLPGLSLLLALAAATESILGEILEPFLRRSSTREVLIALYERTILARNVAAILGLIVLLQAVAGLLRHHDFAPLGRRLSIVTFAGIFAPVTILSLGVRVPPQLVLLATASGTCLGLMSLLAVSFDRRRTWSSRLAATTGAIALVLPFFALCLQLIPALAFVGRREDLQHVLRLGGESLFLLFVSVAAAKSFPRRGGLLAWIGRGLGAFVGLGLGVGILVVAALGRERFANMMYGVFGLGVTADSVVTAAVLAALVAAFVAALFAPDVERRRRVIATGAFLMLLAGYGPSTIAEVIVASAGALLLARGLSAR